MNGSEGNGERRRKASRQRLVAFADEELVELVLGGDDIAFEVLFDRHVADAVWFARDLLGSWGEAEEAVRHSFAAAHAYLASRDRNIEFAPWLHTILSNHCLSMLQARGPKPGDRAEVVDLAQWRRRRKGLGIAAPLAPSAALHDSVMTACGIGTTAGAGTAGASLLGGTLAKVAVVALLAGGAGVAGHAVSEPGAPVGGSQTKSQMKGDEAVASTSSLGDGHDPTVSTVRRRLTESVMRERRRRTSPADRGRSAPRAHTPTAGAPLTRPPSAPTSGPAPGVGQPGGAAPAERARAVVPGAPVSTESPTAAPVTQPARSALDAVGDVVRTTVPDVAAALPRVAVPVDLGAIGDDLGVTPESPPIDVRALLSPGSSAPAR